MEDIIQIALDTPYADNDLQVYINLDDELPTTYTFRRRLSYRRGPYRASTARQASRLRGRARYHLISAGAKNARLYQISFGSYSCRGSTYKLSYHITTIYKHTSSLEIERNLA